MSNINWCFYFLDGEKTKWTVVFQTADMAEAGVRPIEVDFDFEPGANGLTNSLTNSGFSCLHPQDLVARTERIQNPA